ncbi:hypothetical protein GPECTOR_59g639 [Gonium pectorale]|uniref:Amine oxidase domain-containing protein n=1 Tax=Gonium pectorale TaxID=33097 RepID=A0A150G5C9_GONPE|nr:hypothetical protein GPECTOR_59g639 [Gonium pectorale]|eukprot:KXZ45031.1 hypothetical protein GPECTOR_59g639 [Gonium pectorale]
MLGARCPRVSAASREGRRAAAVPSAAPSAAAAAAAAVSPLAAPLTAPCFRPPAAAFGRGAGRVSARRRRQLPVSPMVAAAAVAGADGLSSSSSSSGAEGRRVVIVGGGWAGFGAAKHLSEQGYDVTLLEASPNPGGLSAGWRTASGRAVEAGMKGFWYQYKNTFRLLDELQLPSWPLTDFTTSGFWNPRGLVTEAPVFSKLPRLPTLVGQFVHTFPLYWALPLEDRLTMLPFLATLADYVSSEERYEQYDKMSAYELFRSCGVSARCYNEFLRPTLLVGLFAPPEELSAAAVLETLYFYALAHQNDFDVCWPRGSIAELIFAPMVERIKAAGGRVLGNRLVTGLTVDPATGEVSSVEAADRSTGDWVKGVPHGANGLSQERAYVTGLSAANLVMGRLGRGGAPAQILDVEPDEPHIAAARAAARGLRELAAAAGLRSPFL